jgi:hypothetical protein
MRLCRELQAGRPSRHRHLRRGADLKNRNPYRPSPLSQEDIWPREVCSDAAIVELFRPEERVCMGHKLATACGAGLRALDSYIFPPSPVRHFQPLLSSLPLYMSASYNSAQRSYCSRGKGNTMPSSVPFLVGLSAGPLRILRYNSNGVARMA